MKEIVKNLSGITGSDIQDAMNVTQIASLEKEIDLKDNSSVSFGDTIASPRNDYEEMLSEERCLTAIQQVSDTIIDDTYRGIWEEYIYGLMYGESSPRITLPVNTVFLRLKSVDSCGGTRISL